MRVDQVLVVALASTLGGAIAFAPAPALAALIGALGLLLRRVPYAVLGLAAVVAAAQAARALFALDAFDEEYARVRDALGAPAVCVGRAEVVRSPTVRGGVTRVIADAAALECEGRVVSGPVRLRLYGGPADLRRGDVVDLVAKVATVSAFRNAELPDPRPRMVREGSMLSGSTLSLEVVERGRGLGAIVDRARGHARERIDATFAPEAAPMARALVLGESDLDEDDDEAFRKSGLAHLLAVSGTHLVFAVVTLTHVLTAVLVRIERWSASFDVARVSAATGAVLALLYADFAGGSGSAWRAAFMLTAAFGARACARRPLPERTLALSVLVGATFDPFVLSDVSFVLSAAATVGLLTLGRPLGRLCDRVPGRALKYISSSLAATVASMVPCVPLFALMGADLTLAGLFANVIAAPLGEVVSLPICLAHSLLTLVPALEHGAALVASGALLAVKKVAHVSAAQTWLAVPLLVPGAWHLAVSACGVLAGVVASSLRVRAIVAIATAIAFIAVECGVVRAGRPTGMLRVTALDVGQGDSTLVDLPDGTLVLVDGGGFVGSPVDPGTQVILPVLRARRRERIDIAILSHPHPDHFGGLATALEKIEVGELWDSGQGEVEGAGPVYRTMIEGLRARGVPIIGPAALCGEARSYGGAEVTLLGPCPTFVRGRDANDNSMVVRIAFGARAVLLAGDAEREQELELVRRHGSGLRADLLKVGHHGSRTSSTRPWLDVVRPAIATISCGVRNRFGHPHAEALSSLESAGALSLRLDRTGSVTWETDGTDVALRLTARRER